jgi:hypothetical protein
LVERALYGGTFAHALHVRLSVHQRAEVHAVALGHRSSGRRVGRELSAVLDFGEERAGVAEVQRDA